MGQDIFIELYFYGPQCNVFAWLLNKDEEGGRTWGKMKRS
jgi:hypothetical protein